MDADYAAILSYATTQGYTLPSASQQTLQNQLVVDLKAAGVWSKLDTFAVFATDGDSDFALIDWINLSQYTAVNSPTFTSNQGFQGDGTSSYIDSNYNPTLNGVNYTLTDFSFGWYMNQYDTSASNQECAFGTTASGLGWNWVRYATKRFYYTGTSFNAYSNLTIGSNQFIVANRSGTSLNLYNNGSLTDTSSVASAGIPNSAFCAFINFTNNSYSDSELSLVYAGGDLSSEQSDFNTAWYNYYNSL